MTDRIYRLLIADIRSALSTTEGSVNVADLAETIRQRREVDNVALEDVMNQVAAIAVAEGRIVEFDRGYAQYLNGNRPALVLEVIEASNE